MLGVQTRLRLTLDQDFLLGAFLGEVATLARTAYQRVATGKLAAERNAVYAWATGQGLTAHQASSIAARVEQWRATDQAVLDHRIESLQLRLDALEDAVKALDDRQASLKAATFLSEKAIARLKTERFQKNRSLCNKRQQLDSLRAAQARQHVARIRQSSPAGPTPSAK